MFEKKISPFTAMIVVCDKKGDDHIGSGVLISANHILTYIIHSGFISGYQNRYGDNLKPPTNVYHRMTA